MENLKLKNILELIDTSGVVKFSFTDTNESFYPRFSDFQDYYSEYYVTKITAKNNELIIEISTT